MNSRRTMDASAASPSAPRSTNPRISAAIIWETNCARFQPTIEHSGSGLNHTLRAAQRPAHLPQLIHARNDQRVDRGLCSRTPNRQTLPIALTIIDYGSWLNLKYVANSSMITRNLFIFALISWVYSETALPTQ
jgi:hypothetical protein